MVRGATFSRNGIPFCPTTAKEIPCKLISYTEARATYNRRMNRGDKNFFVNAFSLGEPQKFFVTSQGLSHQTFRPISTSRFRGKFSIPIECGRSGFFKMIEVLRPHTIIVYGSDKYPCFDSIRQQIKIVKFDSEHALAFAEKNHV